LQATDRASDRSKTSEISFHKLEQHAHYNTLQQHHFDFQNKFGERKMVKFSNNEDGDEQKRDDVHESPLVSTGRIPSVELPNETSPTSSILKKGELLGDGKVLKSSLSPEKSTDENLKLNTPQSEQRSTVSFTGIGDGDSVAGDIPIGASREESLERELQQLRGKLTQVQIDLQAEKATRKRKEKNLFKLAKELNKRTAEIDFKDVQIKRVSFFLNLFFRSCVIILVFCIRGNYEFSLRTLTINCFSRINESLPCFWIMSVLHLSL
jgi:hypothetical protein